MEPIEDDGDARNRSAVRLAILGALGYAMSTFSTHWFAIQNDQGASPLGPATWWRADGDTLDGFHGHTSVLAIGILTVFAVIGAATAVVWMSLTRSSASRRWTSFAATAALLLAGILTYSQDVHGLLGPGLPVFLASSVLVLVGAALVVPEPSGPM
jgi:hypothetical protein